MPSTFPTLVDATHHASVSMPSTAAFRVSSFKFKLQAWIQTLLSVTAMHGCPASKEDVEWMDDEVQQRGNELRRARAWQVSSMSSGTIRQTDLPIKATEVYADPSSRIYRWYVFSVAFPLSALTSFRFRLGDFSLWYGHMLLSASISL
ncbi:hypothetical protein ARMGADRAFT_669663 [Armillaria gallica]|uniref:Uncharacterized protein n=1 Tax=Armillaria gallica TaxID=47427 RepID=A0A2H3CK75_ARMGA|nr:hypothetical protein ARMGADRAFT_669663 [Armillaria gallica]